MEQKFKLNPENKPEPKPGAYLITNLVNGKTYVGISLNIKRRMREHARADGTATLLSRAVKKYGADSFEFTPIYYSIDGTGHLPEVEERLIAEFSSCANGYNIQAASGAVGPYGEKFSSIIKAAKSTPESKTRMAESSARYWAKSEAIEAQSTRSKEISSRPGVNEKRSQSMKEKFSDPEYAAAHKARVKASKTQDVINRSAESLKNTLASEDHKSRLRAQWLLKCTPEKRADMLEKMKRTMSTEEFKKKRSEACIKVNTEEHRAEKSARLKEIYRTTDLAKKISDSRKGRVWVTNGASSMCLKDISDTPPGWWSGRPKKSAMPT